MRHDPGLAASPPVCYILKMAGSEISLPLFLLPAVDRQPPRGPWVRGRPAGDHPRPAARTPARTAGRPRRRPLPRHHPAHQRHRLRTAFDVATAVADYVAWRASNPRRKAHTALRRASGWCDRDASVSRAGAHL